MGYKSAVQILQQAEDIKSKVLQNYDLLNHSDAWTEQQKLQNIYHQVLILDLEYALDKKVEQDLWNVGFKNYITHLQELVRDKKNSKRSDCQALLTWCLESASGFYISLLQELCNTFDVDFPFRRQGRVYGQNREVNCSFNSPQSSSYSYICQYCLVHLGDIARYRNQRKEAESFYKQAIQVSSASGHPYNQLALLEASLGDKLSTVFYYIRGVAVKNPFPVASTNLLSTFNLLIDKESLLEKIEIRMTTSEFVNLFLCVHGFLYTATCLDQTQLAIKSLNSTMTALVATESFNDDKLVKMTVINLYAFKHVVSGSTNMEHLTSDEVQIRRLILDLIAGSLSAFLVPVHTLKMDESLLDYYSLPAVNIIFQWIQRQPNVLSEPEFAGKLQIWPSFCKLLNNVQVYLKDLDYEKYKNMPLSEDRRLEGFLPLGKYFEELDFTLKIHEENKDIQKVVRMKRILDFALWLSDFDVNGTKLITKSESSDNSITFEPGCIQPDPTNDLLEEIKSFSIETKLEEIKKSEKKAGILKPQGSLEKSREERELLSSNEASLASDSSFNSNSNSSLVNKNETAKMKRAKQNAALQSIYKKMEENKQVKFAEAKDNRVLKFDQKTSNKNANSTSTNHFGSSVRTQSFNQNHPAFPSGSNSQHQDYLTTLRNMTNTPSSSFNYGNNMGAPNNMQYPQQMFNNGMQQSRGGWSGASGPQTLDGQSWWHGQQQSQAGMMPPGGNMMNPGGGNMMNPASGMNPAGHNMMNPASVNMMNYGAGPNNQASGDTFGTPWANNTGNYGKSFQGNQGFGMNNGMGNFDNTNMSMRQAMLKEANIPMNNNVNPKTSSQEPINYCKCTERYHR